MLLVTVLLLLPLPLSLPLLHKTVCRSGYERGATGDAVDACPKPRPGSTAQCACSFTQAAMVCSHPGGMAQGHHREKDLAAWSSVAPSRARHPRLDPRSCCFGCCCCGATAVCGWWRGVAAAATTPRLLCWLLPTRSPGIHSCLNQKTDTNTEKHRTRYAITC